MSAFEMERLPTVKKDTPGKEGAQAEINALLVELGRAGKRVVRLKSGDPLVFGRAGLLTEAGQGVVFTEDGDDRPAIAGLPDNGGRDASDARRHPETLGLELLPVLLD